VPQIKPYCDGDPFQSLVIHDFGFPIAFNIVFFPDDYHFCKTFLCVWNTNRLMHRFTIVKSDDGSHAFTCIGTNTD